jgi:hypothetical protein
MNCEVFIDSNVGKNAEGLDTASHCGRRTWVDSSENPDLYSTKGLCRTEKVMLSQDHLVIIKSGV